MVRIVDVTRNSLRRKEEFNRLEVLARDIFNGESKVSLSDLGIHVFDGGKMVVGVYPLQKKVIVTNKSYLKFAREFAEAYERSSRVEVTLEKDYS